MKRFILLIALGLTVAFSSVNYVSPPVEASYYAQIFQTLLSAQRASGVTLSGGFAYFYVAGSNGSQLATVYANRGKTVIAANPVTLDSNGTAVVYGDGLYDVKITDSANVQKFNWLGVYLTDYLTSGVYAAVQADYTSLNTAIRRIGSAPTTLNIVSPNFPMTAAAVVPSTLQINVIAPGSIANSTYGLTINGFFSAPLTQVFMGTGTVMFGVNTVTSVYPQWWGAISGDTTFDQTAAFTAACNSSATNYPVHVVVPPGDYRGNFTFAQRNLIVDFPGNSIGMNNVKYSQLRPWSTGSPVVTLGNNTALTTMTIRGMNINSETTLGSGSHAAIGLNIIGGSNEIHLDDLGMTGAFTSSFIKMRAGATLETSKIFINGMDLVNLAGASPPAMLDLANISGDSYLSAIYVNNFTIVGPLTGGVMTLDSAGIEMASGYIDLYGGAGITLTNTVEAAGLPYLKLTNVTLDCAAPGGVIFTNNTKATYGGSTHNATLNTVLNTVNSTFSSNASINDNGTTFASPPQTTSWQVSPVLQYPYIADTLYLTDFDAYVLSGSLGSASNSIYLSNLYGGGVGRLRVNDNGGIYAEGGGPAGGQFYGKAVVFARMSSAHAPYGSTFNDAATGKITDKDNSGALHAHW